MLYICMVVPLSEYVTPLHKHISCTLARCQQYALACVIYLRPMQIRMITPLKAINKMPSFAFRPFFSAVVWRSLLPIRHYRYQHRDLRKIRRISCFIAKSKYTFYIFLTMFRFLYLPNLR